MTKCCNCANDAEVGKEKRTYCKPCFKKIWNNSEENYNNWYETRYT